MVRCSVIGCKNRPERRLPNITFHTFPKETSTLNRWIRATGRKNWLPGKSHRICSIHFESRYFRKTKKKTYLMPNAIPTLFTTDIIVERLSTAQQSKIHGPGLKDVVELPNTSEQPKTPEPSLEDITELPSTSKQSKAPEPSFEVETPRKIKLRKKLINKEHVAEQRKKKIAVLRTRAWRLKKKNAELCSILEDLKARSLHPCEAGAGR
ncbi:THAP domain-containing protein 2-like [Colias croceus]|uniref:THAP domain-containing protein 2-like n=1 Tax=Colias crocea TaxID=72248 RepID=UPI001E27B069|nr:THAP domain-containing protein 2-like [Colias croceus]